MLVPFFTQFGCASHYFAGWTPMPFSAPSSGVVYATFSFTSVTVTVPTFVISLSSTSPVS